jgi:predicted acyltransferase
MKTTVSQRLLSIDVLRGFDMFFLVGAGDILRRFVGGFDTEALDPVMYQLSHADWIGFTAWDIIMPLFLFTSGLSLPFSFGKFREQGHSKKQLYIKIVRRFFLLFLLGWIAQGNLLDLSPDRFHIYCNTLHSIAFGYLITALIILNIRNVSAQIAVGCSLVIGYWLLLTFIPVPGYGNGVFTPEGNLAIHIDHSILGRFDDGTQYTWILSSLGFAATVFSGYCAGLLMKKDLATAKRLQYLLIIGVALIAGGLLWSLQMPVIKKIWSCSMILLSSGICFLLLALIYQITDRWQIQSGFIKIFRVLGLNSIAAYMLHTTLGLGYISRHLLRGFEQYTDTFFPLVVTLGEFCILYFIIHQMYKHGIFLKV